jgi:hypothetical protein
MLPVYSVRDVPGLYPPVGDTPPGVFSELLILEGFKSFVLKLRILKGLRTPFLKVRIPKGLGSLSL